MTREEAINHIERSFPADATSCAVAVTGLRLLDQAKREYYDWRDLPTGLLQRYAALCTEEQRRIEMAADRVRTYYDYSGTQASHSADALEQREATHE